MLQQNVSRQVINDKTCTAWAHLIPKSGCSPRLEG